MIDKTYGTTNAKAAWFVLLACVGALTGCAADEGDDESNVLGQPPTGANDGGFVSDASAATTPTPEGGTTTATTPDSGMTAKPDAGMGNLPDSGSVTTDSGALTDAAAMTSDSGTPDSGMMIMRPDQGMGDGKDVVTIGDSWMNLSAGVGIENSLERVSKRDYRNYAISGTKLLSGTNNIQTQYAKAKGEGSIKTVVMTGGGNDILQELLLPCLDENFDNDNKCPMQIDAVAAGLVKLWAQMASDGVQDVLIVGYSNKTMPLGLGGTTKSIAYSNMKIPPLCEMVPAPLRCTALDTDMAVPNLATRADGIHPDDRSYDAIGTVVWKLMQDKGMRR